MRTFSCQCGNTVYFMNTHCVQCGATLGYIPDQEQLSALSKNEQGTWQAALNGKNYKPCKNYQVEDVCNWMIPAASERSYCDSCELTQTIPNLNQPDNKQLWFRMEQAKRRLLYTLHKLDLPIISRQKDSEHGLGFEFLEDQVEDEFGNELTVKNFVSTGHSAGIITLNLKEAEHSSRVKMREQMNEQYRTLLGHFRHESGHYYWDRLVRNGVWLTEFRELFGDERLDYAEALKSYYQNGPLPDWYTTWVSAYASMHPWEDWAETWAHYLHMVDTLETASEFDFWVSSHQLSNPLQHFSHNDEREANAQFDQLYDDWCRLTAVLNALNRSMGLEDAYPFVIPSLAIAKLRFVHKIICSVNDR